MTILGFVLTLIGGLIPLVSATGKLTGQEQVIEILDHVEVTGTCAGCCRSCRSPVGSLR